MRILLVTAYFRPHVGGIERFAENLALGLATRGHEVKVLCCRTESGSPLREQIDGYATERVPATNVAERHLGVPYPVPQPFALLQALRRSLPQADVVHVQDSLYASSLPTLLLARRHEVPSVLTQHVAFVPQRSPWLNALERVALATVGRSSRLASVVATVNPSVAEWAEGFWRLRDVRVLPVGVPLPAKRVRDRAELRASFGLPADRFLALFVGRDVHTKGLDVFLTSHDAAYELVAVTNRAAAEGRATLLPFMSSERLQDLFSCVDAFVLPSEREAMPVSLQEALAQGLPVVTTFQPGYERYLSPEDVLYVERDPKAVRDALMQLVHDEALRGRLAERGMAAAKRHFGIESFVAAYEALYAELMRAPR
jgi:glycosyltransferase involved in cell wall biosynthesis